MLTLRIYSFEKAKQSFIKAGEAEYVKRMKSLAKVEMLPLKSPKAATSDKRREAAVLFSRLTAQDLLVVLDESGRKSSSLAFSQQLQDWMLNGRSQVNFAIGGTDGWDPQVLARADLVLALSAFTFTAEFSRLILLEQLYRALTIIKGQRYHK